MPAQPIASRFASPDSSSGPREIRTVPDPGRTSEARILMSVVLPLPLGPATAVSPVSMEKERPLKRGGPAKDFESPIASSFVGSTAARDDSMRLFQACHSEERSDEVRTDGSRFFASLRMTRKKRAKG